MTWLSTLKHDPIAAPAHTIPDRFEDFVYDSSTPYRTTRSTLSNKMLRRSCGNFTYSSTTATETSFAAS